jgi:pilus assembly protein Flp/PilA
MTRSLLRGFLRDDEAATASEYAFMLVLIIVAVIASVNAVGNSTAQGWSKNVNIISTSLNNVGS